MDCVATPGLSRSAMSYAAAGQRRHPSLADHPGYLGMTSQGIIAIHAEGPSISSITA
jgi:hypothetical protein